MAGSSTAPGDVGQRAAPLRVGTHNGPFHADDVLAWALVRRFVDADPVLVRTRDEGALAACDLVFDVGGELDPARLRFDHHQHSYTGPRSSAGMVLDWLLLEGRVSPRLGELLRAQLVDYVDDVDNGRREPTPGVPCFARMVDALNRGCADLPAYDAAFRRAGELAAAYVDGIRHDHAEREAARALVLAALADAERAGSNLLVLPEYVRWKPAYYEAGGASHPTEFVLHPGLEGGWRALAIPPGETSFAQKVPFPEAWAGLTDGELEAVVGVKGARFCHKNLFIAVFDGWPSMIASLRAGGLIRGPEPRPPASAADPTGIA